MITHSPFELNKIEWISFVWPENVFNNLLVSTSYNNMVQSEPLNANNFPLGEKDKTLFDLLFGSFKGGNWIVDIISIVSESNI